MVSVYHRFLKEKHGEEEKQASLFFQKNKSKRYHIDYILVPEAWLPRVRAVSIGDDGDWLHLSDHMPLLVTIDD